jgi:hypothetical protein
MILREYEAEREGGCWWKSRDGRRVSFIDDERCVTSWTHYSRTPYSLTSHICSPIKIHLIWNWKLQVHSSFWHAQHMEHMELSSEPCLLSSSWIGLLHRISLLLMRHSFLKQTDLYRKVSTNPYIKILCYRRWYLDRGILSPEIWGHKRCAVTRKSRLRQMHTVSQFKGRSAQRPKGRNIVRTFLSHLKLSFLWFVLCSAGFETLACSHTVSHIFATFQNRASKPPHACVTWYQDSSRPRKPFRIISGNSKRCQT